MHARTYVKHARAHAHKNGYELTNLNHYLKTVIKGRFSLVQSGTHWRQTKTLISHYSLTLFNIRTAGAL